MEIIMPNKRLAHSNDLSLHNLHVSRLAQRIDQQLGESGFAVCCGVKIKQNHFSFRSFIRSTGIYTAWGGVVGAAYQSDSVREIASIIDEYSTRNDAVQFMQQGGRT
jgi:hypothetical protein